MLSTTQILQFVLLAVIFAAALLFLAGRSKTIKWLSDRQLMLIYAPALFLVIAAAEAVFSVYYLKFIFGYGINAALLSAGAVIILILPFSGYTARAISVIRSVPFKITMPVKKTAVIENQSELKQLQGKESTNLPETIAAQNIEEVSRPEIEISGQIKSEEKDSALEEIAVDIIDQETNEKTTGSDVAPVISGESESDITDNTQANAETGKSTTGNQPVKRKPSQKSAAKKPQGGQTHQKNTSGKTRGRRKK